MAESLKNQLSDATAAVHGGEDIHLGMVTRAKVMPIFETSVFTYDRLEDLDDFLTGNPDNYSYTRLGNPNQRALEDWILGLETADLPPGNWDALATGSGMAAIAACIGSVCDAGSRVALSRDIYGGTQSLLEHEFRRWAVEAVFLDFSNIEEGGLPPGIRLVLVEAASNPLMRVSNIKRLAGIAHSSGARLVVDNSFLSPALFKPLAHGADAVIHSTTKYINGHSDASGGLLVAPAEWAASARRVVQNLGGHLSPFEAWLTLRGARTLELRMAAHSQNGQAIAEWLEERPEVRRVWYPGLASHPEHELAKQQFPRGIGGMMSFDLKGGSESVAAFMQGLKLIKLAPSLAGLTTSFSYPMKTSHRAHSPESLRELQITPATIRLSVGIENRDDIIADLKAGLRVTAGTGD